MSNMNHRTRVRGLKKKDVIDHAKLIRDTRPLSIVFMDMITVDTNGYLFAMLTLAVIPFFFGWLMLPAFGAAIVLSFFRRQKTKMLHLPLRMPISSHVTDYNTRHPAGGYEKASGTFFIGNQDERDGVFGTGYELWVRIRDALTHFLVFGTTGSGKTEFMISMAANPLAMGSGFSYIDPKGSDQLKAQVYILARMCGRDDDFRVSNYSTMSKGNQPYQGTPRKTTNTMNPFAYGNAESLANMLNSLIPKSEGGNAIFSQNAQALCVALMYSLVELRDKGELDLSVSVVRDYMTLEKNLELLKRNISDQAKNAMKAFLSSVGWEESKGDKQARSLGEQHGYARSYFGRALGSMTDTYGHIYGTSLGETDKYDVVQNRRILLTTIPALAMSEEEVKNLGVIELSSVKTAISMGLGSGKEGTFKDLIYSLPTDAPAPFLSITDEYAAMPVPGYIEVLTQGRGLGVCAIVGSQDYAGIQKADPEAAEQMVENTKLKVCMKINAGGKTYELFEGIAGKEMVMETSGYSINKEETLPTTYRDDLSVRAVEKSRINLQDLQEQIEGEFHLFFNNDVIRGKAFYVNPRLLEDDQLRYNHLIPVFPPEKYELDARIGQVRKLVDTLIELGEIELKKINSSQDTADTEDTEDSLPLSNEIQVLGQFLTAPQKTLPQESYKKYKKECVIAGFLAWMAARGQFVHDAMQVVEDVHDVPETQEENDVLGDTLDDALDSDVYGIPESSEYEAPKTSGASEAHSVSYADKFTSKVIKGELEGDLTRINEAAGLSHNEAKQKSQTLVQQIEQAVSYPVPPTPEAIKKTNRAADNELPQAMRQNEGREEAQKNFERKENALNESFEILMSKIKN